MGVAPHHEDWHPWGCALMKAERSYKPANPNSSILKSSQKPKSSGGDHQE